MNHQRDVPEHRSQKPDPRDPNEARDSLHTQQRQQDDHCHCVAEEPLVQPPCRRKAPTGDRPLYKKRLGVFLQIFNILRKKGEINFKIGRIG
jgi:hypothetical protein